MIRTAIAIAAAAGVASAGIEITETWTGLSGEDGTQDWIEVTYYGPGTFDTGTIYYDDSSASVADGGLLDSFILSNGESAVFLLDTAPVDDLTYSTAIEEFTAIWGPVLNLGHTNGGGGLGQSGDEAYLLDAANNILDVLAYAASGDLATFEKLGGITRLSVLGENGAYESNPFFNDNLGLPDDTATLIGSPGAVPAPATVALLGLAGLGAASRRR
ncbi:MAG: PEP-CTERM sorting domain-containing protein [Phycisphaeraceae bacterium]|nr:MAG: PEP-CTERM sorting domain-containing protein [Phycisphaeraceae bacterium]